MEASLGPLTCPTSTPVPGVAPRGRRVLSHHGVGVKALLIFPEILEEKESVRAIDQRPLRVTAGTELELGAERKTRAQREGGERGRGQVWPGRGMQGGG